MKTWNEAQAARDKALNQLAASTDPAWSLEAEAAIIHVAMHKDEFFADDVWNTGLAWPDSPRAIGPVYVKVANAGFIEKTDRSKPSVNSNLSGKPVWRSLIR